LNQNNVWDLGQRGSCLTTRRQVWTTGLQIPKDCLERGDAAMRARKTKPSPVDSNTLFKDLHFSRKNV